MLTYTINPSGLNITASAVVMDSVILWWGDGWLKPMLNFLGMSETTGSSSPLIPPYPEHRWFWGAQAGIHTCDRGTSLFYPSLGNGPNTFANVGTNPTPPDATPR